MKASGWLALTGMLVMIGVAGCQQSHKAPRLDTSNQQAFTESLTQVRSQLDQESIEQFDRAINYAQHTYYLQKQYSMVPASNPLDGLTAEQVLKLTPENQKQKPRRLRNWTRI